MPIDQKEVFEYLGIKDAPENLEAFRKSFDSSYIKRSPEVIKNDETLYGQVVADKVGATVVKFRRELKNLGVEVTRAESEGKNVDDIIETGLKRFHEQYSGKISELESQAGKGNDEKFSDLQKQLEKAQSKYNDTKGLLDGLTQEYEGFKTKAASEIKGVKRQVKFGEALKSIKWKSGIKDIEKEGYFSTFDKEYKVDLDDNDNIEIFDKSGKRITSPKESGKFAQLEEVLEMHGRKVDVWETNPIADRGRVIPQHITQLGQPANGQPGVRQRMVHPAARANEGKH